MNDAKPSPEEIAAEVARDLEASRGVDVSELRTVCLALGPYRNLTTWTGATLFLHPNIQVLNHAGNRVFGQEEVDFLDGFSPAKLTRFAQYAVHISAGGRRGRYGGSITRSHAFDQGHKMGEVFEEAGLGEVKEQVHSLFWKESLVTALQVRKRGIDLSDLIAADDRLRFLQPIRHPLDSAVSNISTGHYKRLVKGEPTTEKVAAAILDEYAWYAGYRSKHPDRFLHFFEHSLSRQTFVDLAAFLGVSADERWLDLAVEAMDIKKGYEHAPELVAAYRDQVEERFGGDPELRRGLLAFVDAEGAPQQ